MSQWLGGNIQGFKKKNRGSNLDNGYSFFWEKMNKR